MYQISGVSERDTDLLLVEAISSRPDFLNFLLENIGFSKYIGGKLTFIGRSVTQSIGESDVELLIEKEGITLCVMIENKINASFQPQQDERYRLRGENRVKERSCDEFHSVLFAPEIYLDGYSGGFDSVLSYEKLINWYQSHQDTHTAYKIYLLQQAVGKAQVGYSMIADQPVTDFRESYYSLVCERYPTLNMDKPGNKPSTSSFIYLKPLVLSGTNVKLVHKLIHGAIDLQFGGSSHLLNEMTSKFPLGEYGYEYVKSGKSLSIRYQGENIDPGRSFDEQKANCKKGLDNAISLLELFEEHLQEFKKMGVC